MSLRQKITQNIVATLKNMEFPQPVLATSEPFEPDRLAITQFPAVLVTAVTETRSTISMGMGGVGRRSGEITLNLRGYVRGTDIVQLRNTLIEAIEEELDRDRYRGLKDQGVQDSQITEIAIVERLPPLGEFTVTVVVDYNFLRGQS
jgi:hypothetical protein